MLQWPWWEPAAHDLYLDLGFSKNTFLFLRLFFSPQGFSPTSPVTMKQMHGGQLAQKFPCLCCWTLNPPEKWVCTICPQEWAQWHRLGSDWELDWDRDCSAEGVVLTTELWCWGYPISLIMDTASGHSTDTAITSGNWIACHSPECKCQNKKYQGLGEANAYLVWDIKRGLWTRPKVQIIWDMLSKGPWAQLWICWGSEGVAGHVHTKETDWMPSRAKCPHGAQSFHLQIPALVGLTLAPWMPVFVGSASTCCWGYCRLQTTERAVVWSLNLLSTPYMDSCICSRGKWLIWVWPPPGVMPSTRTQGISTKRHMLLVLVSSVCMQQWSSSSSSTHQSHRRAGWPPMKAVRMGCSSLCSCPVLGQPASHSEGELLRCGDSKLLRLSI